MLRTNFGQPCYTGGGGDPGILEGGGAPPMDANAEGVEKNEKGFFVPKMWKK